MAVATTMIDAVRVAALGGDATEYAWNPDAWYLLRDDRPFLDVLVRGHLLKAVDAKMKLAPLDEPAPDGCRWQRWDLEADLARERRLGEVSLPLAVPKAMSLQCYIIPTQVVDLADVLAMLADIELEFGWVDVWDRAARRTGRAWSHRERRFSSAPEQLVATVENELRAARDIRHRPFQELGLHGRRGVPLSENAFVSHWAVRRLMQLNQTAASVGEQLEHATRSSSAQRPSPRLAVAATETRRLEDLAGGLEAMRSALSTLVWQAELETAVSPGPAFQRDHRLRCLLAAFAPPEAERVSPIAAARSTYPPVLLNDLWELWGAVWLATQLRRMGFEGRVSTRGSAELFGCSWDLRRGEVVAQLDYEPDPVLLDLSTLPPAHERTLPALEWAATRQLLDEHRPFLGSEVRCSPDYMLRVSTPSRRVLAVGDACLASPEHHGTGKASPKPLTVEHYRRTLGWAVGGRIVRCHPMGGFVLFPPPEDAWSRFESLQDARDCTLLCPSPGRDMAASRRFENILRALAPEVSWPAESR
jgi:hypothetical protein